MSDESKAKLDSLSAQIQQVRDELEVQMHLGAAEARSEWEKVETKLDRFRAQSEQVASVADDTLEGILEAASLAGDEILHGYQKIKSMLSK
jgi:uncharacterized protein (DUF3084 family)